MLLSLSNINVGKFFILNFAQGMKLSSSVQSILAKLTSVLYLSYNSYQVGSNALQCGHHGAKNNKNQGISVWCNVPDFGLYISL